MDAETTPKNLAYPEPPAHSTPATSPGVWVRRGRTGELVGSWAPLATPGVRTDRWDLVGRLTRVEEADRLVDLWMRPALTTDLAAFYAPEASTLLASLLWAARRSGLDLATVCACVALEYPAEALTWLREAGDVEVARDLEAVTTGDPHTVAGAWSVARLAVQPLQDRRILHSLCGDHWAFTDRVPADSITVWNTADSVLDGLAAGLAELLRIEATRHEQSVTVTTVFHRGGELS